ncbi:kinesin-like protein KIF9 [Corticium candelabrum]|uniref:kinesin-like protein KIF9 n=1 Tax=Corticium candelabrum TaxID=121492 RepID=UPI002E255946|nr:kinesin-like protein KIF9 [Corticium candelabrum]
MSAYRKVKVAVRVRPTSKFASDAIVLDRDGQTISVRHSEIGDRGYVNHQVQGVSLKADCVLHNASQELVYNKCADEIVNQAMEGFNGTILAYGQTGAGKTFTMTGTTENFRHRGIIPRALAQVFREIEERPDQSIIIRVSYLEIYNEAMFDLLSTLPDSDASLPPNSLTVAESEGGATMVKGLTVRLAHNEEEALNLLFEGETNRAIATHSLNKNSSRSHCIFTVYIEARSRTQTSAQYTVSKLNLVDLAGSERLKKTNSEGATQREAMYINKSLSFLEQVVVALGERNRDHIPYRQSKLTHVLKDSIGANCNTLMIANVWGEPEQTEETMSTLRFAQRMMLVKNALVKNIQQDPTLLIQQHEREIKMLKQELAMHDTLSSRGHISYEPLTDVERYEIHQQVRHYLEGSLTEIPVVNLRQIQETFAQFKSVVSSLESEVEARVTQRTTVSGAESISGSGIAPKSAGSSSEQAGFVGDIDGQGFGVGVAPSSAKAVPGSVIAARKLKGRKSKDNQMIAKTGSPPLDGGVANQMPIDAILEEKTGEQSQTAGDLNKPSTPPPRSEAFEEFKRERGSEITHILTENKSALNEKQKTSRDYASSVNAIKRQIDETRHFIEQQKQERMEDGLVGEAGEAVITEEEFTSLSKLRELKARYKEEYEELRVVKSEVQYCQHLVDQCRQKLLVEFDKWYADCYLIPEQQTTVLTRSQHLSQVSLDSIIPEDEADKFDRLQTQQALENPEAAAFYNAKIRTERRAFANMSYVQKKRPGAVTHTVRNKPPSTLAVG